jgi:hypothetical protein
LNIEKELEGKRKIKNRRKKETRRTQIIIAKLAWSLPRPRKNENESKRENNKDTENLQ